MFHNAIEKFNLKDKKIPFDGTFFCFRDTVNYEMLSENLFQILKASFRKNREA